MSAQLRTPSTSSGRHQLLPAGKPAVDTLTPNGAARTDGPTRHDRDHHRGRIYRGAAHDPGRGVHGAEAAIVDADCPVIRPGARYVGAQGPTFAAGVSAESAGSAGLCLHLLTIPPGGRGRAHLHAGHETALYALAGAAETRFGPGLRKRATLRAGEFHYIPAGVPHLPVNLSADDPFVAVVARTDPNEQESVVLLPDLEAEGAAG